MVWIRLRGRVDLEMGIEVEIWVQRKSNKSEKMGRERERARAYVQGLVEGNNKKIEEIDYLNKRGDRIDEST